MRTNMFLEKIIDLLEDRVIDEEGLFEKIKDIIISELEKIINFYNSETFFEKLKREKKSGVDPSKFTYQIYYNKEYDGSINYEFKGFKILNSEFGYYEKACAFTEKEGFVYNSNGCLFCNTMLPFEVHIYPLENEITVSFICYTEHNFRKDFKEELKKKISQCVQEGEELDKKIKEGSSDTMTMWKMAENTRNKDIIKELIENEKERESLGLTDEAPIDKETITFTWDLNTPLIKFLHSVSNQLLELCSNYKEVKFC